MDFFAHQDRARSSTRRLIVVYVLCLIGVVIALNLIAGMIWGATQTAAASRETDLNRRTTPVARSVSAVDALPVFATTTISVLSIIGLATMFKKIQLGGDGAKVAELLGGRPLVAAPTDPDERKLLNVIEEMSLASGVPMPRVYLLDNEEGINAFAAGTRPEAAVIGVTRGCINKLSRDELQGVIAHEFSHILNGDMRLNIRLITLNFGLMAIGYIGLQILRFSPRSSSKSDKGGGAAAMLIFAIAMMIIGYVGTLFGKILQAAVSRQREYLADASAVQFTRNPVGIAGALKKIGGYNGGAEIKSAHAGEMSHMFFADGVVGFLDSLFATHPPLDKRIRAIEPQFDGKMAHSVSVPGLDSGPDAMAGTSGFATTPPPLPRAGQRVVAPASEIVGDAGNIQPEKLVHADATIAAIPRQIEDAAADPYEARAVAIALLLDRSPALRATQLLSVNQVDAYVAAMAEQLQPQIARLGPAARLPILDLALPSLHHMSESQLKDFRALCMVLAKADQRISSFEIALFKIIDHQLLSHRQYDGVVAYRSVSAVADPLRIVLSVLALTGGVNQAQRAYEAAMTRIGLAGGSMAGPEESRQFDRSLSELRQSSMPVQRRVLDACAHCVAADGTVGIEEMELTRAISATLSVPIPPFLESRRAMNSIKDILPFSLAFNVDLIEAFLADVPGKWGVLLLCDREGAPLQIICTRNMRAMLRRRFDPSPEPQTISKRIDYRSLVGSVRWQRVDSELEMDLAYVAAARAGFPVHWKSLIPDRRAFFVRIDPSARLPVFERVDDPSVDGLVFGPFVDKTKADRWIDQMRDAFDLCRYDNILQQSPLGKSCAYKQMGKCPAPCDGSVPIDRYRQHVDRAVLTATDPRTGIEAMTAEMRKLAAAMEFEAAGKVKGRIDLLTALAGGSFRSIRPLGVFDYLSVQPGARKGTAKLFRVTATGVEEVAGVRDESFDLEDLKSVLVRPVGKTDFPPGVLMGAICYYLGSSKMGSRFLACEGLVDADLRKAVRAAMKVQPQPEDAETIRETTMPG